MKKRSVISLVIFPVFTLTIAAQGISDFQERRAPQLIQGGRERITPDENGIIEENRIYKNETEEEYSPEWLRIIYREIDLEKESNRTLIHPLYPLAGQKNLFSVFLHTIAAQTLNVYEYIDGYEVFEKEYQLSPEELFSRLEMEYESHPVSGKSTYHYTTQEEYRINRQIRSWYVKEMWYLDKATSTVQVKILALCPVQHLLTQSGYSRRPLFWVPYEPARHVLKVHFLMASDKNNARAFTMEEFLTGRLYDGEIIKTENALNLTLYQLYEHPDSLKAAQERIEKELASVKNSLYWRPDTVKRDMNIQRQPQIIPSGPVEQIPVEQPVPSRSVRRR